MKSKWKPSRKSASEYIDKMNEIDSYLKNHQEIVRSFNGDSYYFEINGQKYRVSNHSIEASNSGAYYFGNQVRPLYHENGRDSNVRYIHASKTRIIEIYENLVKGVSLDGRGNAL